MKHAAVQLAQLTLESIHMSFHLAVLQEHIFSQQQKQRASTEVCTSDLFDSLLNVLSLTVDDMLGPEPTRP